MQKPLYIFNILICVVLSSASYAAITSESQLLKLRMGMTTKEVRSLYGEPKYTKLYDKDTSSRMYSYDLTTSVGVEYHIYFDNDTAYKLMQCSNKVESWLPLRGDGYAFMNEDGAVSMEKDFSVEGKCLVVTKIFENIELAGEDVNDAIITGISRACNGSQGEFKMKEPKHILYHGIIDKVISFDGRWGSVNVYYSIDVAIKSGKVRIRAIGEEIDWNQDNTHATYYFGNIYPIGEEMMYEVTAMGSYGLVANTLRFFQQYISVIEEELTRKVNDDW